MMELFTNSSSTIAGCRRSDYDRDHLKTRNVTHIRIILQTLSRLRSFIPAGGGNLVSALNQRIHHYANECTNRYLFLFLVRWHLPCLIAIVSQPCQRLINLRGGLLTTGDSENYKFRLPFIVSPAYIYILQTCTKEPRTDGAYEASLTQDKESRRIGSWQHPSR